MWPVQPRSLGFHWGSPRSLAAGEAGAAVKDGNRVAIIERRSRPRRRLKASDCTGPEAP